MEAEAILRFALYKEVLKRKQRRKKRKLNHGGAAGRRGADEEGEGEESDSEEEEEEEEQPERMEMPKPVKQKVEEVELDWDSQTQDVEMDGAPAVPAAPAEDGEKIRPERCVLFRLSILFYPFPIASTQIPVPVAHSHPRSRVPQFFFTFLLSSFAI